MSGLENKPLVSWKNYVDQRFDDSDKAIQAALVAQEKAVIKAENAAEERFKLLNELRSGVATKEQFEALEKVVNDIANRQNENEGTLRGVQLTKTNLIAYVGVVGAILGIIVIVANWVFK